MTDDDRPGALHGELDSLSRAMEAMVRRLSAAQRKNLLKAAFAGQLLPQDPADEPASVLLARIRAARATEPTRSRRSTGKAGKVR